MKLLYDDNVFKIVWTRGGPDVFLNGEGLHVTYLSLRDIKYQPHATRRRIRKVLYKTCGPRWATATL